MKLVQNVVEYNLRNQASRIVKNKDVLDTESVHVRSYNNSQVDGQTDYSNNGSETVNNSNSGSYEESQPSLEPLAITTRMFPNNKTNI